MRDVRYLRCDLTDRFHCICHIQGCSVSIADFPTVCWWRNGTIRRYIVYRKNAPETYCSLWIPAGSSCRYTTPWTGLAANFRDIPLTWLNIQWSYGSGYLFQIFCCQFETKLSNCSWVLFRCKLKDYNKGKYCIWNRSKRYGHWNTKSSLYYMQTSEWSHILTFCLQKFLVLLPGWHETFKQV